MTADERWRRHKKVLRCLGGRHRPRPRKSPGLCQRKRCAEWATNLVFSYGTGIVQRLCDSDLDQYRASLRSSAFDPDRWTETHCFERGA